MDEHIGPVIPANKAEALCVIKPFHFSFDSRHVPYSLRSTGDTVVLWSVNRFLLLVLPLLLGRDEYTDELQYAPDVSVLYPFTLALDLFCATAANMSTYLSSRKTMDYTENGPAACAQMNQLHYQCSGQNQISLIFRESFSSHSTEQMVLASMIFPVIAMRTACASGKNRTAIRSSSSGWAMPFFSPRAR